MKKKLSYLLVTAMAVLNVATISPAFAADAELTEAPNLQAVIQENGTVSPMAEQTVWKYRTYNGVLQKRLWSYTEAKWLTEWMNCTTTFGVMFE